MVADKIADFITRIKNASDVGKTSVALPHTTLLAAVADVLVAEGYLAGVEAKGKGAQKSLVVTLAYNEAGTPKVTGVDRISKLSRRVYLKSADIRPVRSGYGTLILSTPAGVMTGRAAREQKVGGEALFQIW